MAWEERAETDAQESGKHKVSGCRLSLKYKKREWAGKVAQITVGRSIWQEQLVQASKEMMQVTRKQTHSWSPET